ncbi:MAG: GNAT family N-acetyltransferase [Proteobacteria bacterium]|nr:GNAT family N-acetyltransferase [Pseudomonadota bacterium]
MVTPDIVLTDQPDPSAREVILAGLLAFNVAQAGPHAARPLAVLITDPDSGQVVGGLWGRTAWRWLFVDLLFVPEPLRGSGLGASLMRQAEAEAIRRGCLGAWLDTFSFQARGFYEGLGYTMFGALSEYPPGHDRFFMQKPLVPPAV